MKEYVALREGRARDQPIGFSRVAKRAASRDRWATKWIDPRDPLANSATADRRVIDSESYWAEPRWIRGANRLFVADVGQQGHEPRSLDGQGHGVLAGGGAAALAAANDLTLAIGELAQQIEILVVDEHRTGTLAIDENRILLFRANLVLVRASLGRSLELLHTSKPASVNGTLIGRVATEGGRHSILELLI